MKQRFSKIVGAALAAALLGVLPVSADAASGIALDVSNGYVDSANFVLNPAKGQTHFADSPSVSVTQDGWLQLNYFGDGGYLTVAQPFTGDFTCQFTLRSFDVSKTYSGWIGFVFGLPAKDSFFDKACMVIFDGTTNGFIGYNPGVVGQPLANGNGRVWGAANDAITFDSRDDDASANSVTLKYVWDNTLKTLTLYKKNSTETDFGAGNVWNMTPSAQSNGYVGLAFTGETTLQVKDFKIAPSKAANALDNAVVTAKVLQTATQGAPALTTSAVTDSSATLTWPGFAGAASYVLNVFDNSGAFAKSVSASSATATVNGLTKDATYTLQLVAVDANKIAVGYSAALSVTATAPATQPGSSSAPSGTGVSSAAGGSPKTSDATPVLGFAAVLLLACAAAVTTKITRK